MKIVFSALCPLSSAALGEVSFDAPKCPSYDCPLYKSLTVNSSHVELMSILRRCPVYRVRTF